MRIDAHQHFWLLAARQGAWPPPELDAIYRDHLPPQLLPWLKRHGIDATVLVQSLPVEQDTHFMLDLAERYPVIQAVVGWTDLKARNAPERIRALAQHPKLKGLRPMLQALDDDWIADPELAPAVEAMLRHGLRLDALVLPRQLPALLVFAQRFPHMPIVIDHAGKPPIGAGILQPWKDDLARLAALPQIFCKLSGMVNEAPAQWQPGDLQPYVDHVLKVFGAERVMWGSDWPVLNLAADYGRWIVATDLLTSRLGTADKQRIMGLTAQRFYGIAKATPPND